MSEKADYGTKASRKKKSPKSSGHESSGQQRPKKKSYGPFADYIRELRETYGYSQKQVARHLDLSSAAYGYYERGKRNPTAAMIISLSILYSINTNDLLVHAAEAEKHSILANLVRESEEYDPGSSNSSPVQFDTLRIPLSKEEYHLLQYYRSQPPIIQKFIDNIIKNS